MINILHLTDLHYGKHTPNAKKCIKNLAQYIRQTGIKVDYLVCTGDFVDQRDVVDEIAPELISMFTDEFKDFKYLEEDEDASYRLIKKITKSSNDEPKKWFNSTLKQEMNKKFKEVAELLKKFIESISVGIENVVFCCGNHDKLWLAGAKCNITCIGSSTSTKIVDYTGNEYVEAYEPFNDFCKEIGITYNEPCYYDTYYYYANKDVGFQILNTSADKPSGERKACVRCHKIEFNATNRAGFSVCIQHKPNFELCENYSLDYSEGGKSIKQKVLKSCRILLCGDKHVKHEEDSDDSRIYMVGRALNYIDKKKREEQEGECRFILIDDQKKANAVEIYDSFTVKCSTIEQIWYSDELTEEAFKLSQEHIYCSSDSIDDILLSDEKISSDIFRRPGEEPSLNKIKKSSKLFEKVIKIRTNEGTTLPANKNNEIFRYLAEDIILSRSSNNMRINLKGLPCMGICTFAKLLYLYILKNRFGTHSLPIYFDLRYGEKDLNTKYVESLLEQLESLCRILSDLKKRIPKLTIVCFINGMQEIAHFEPTNTDREIYNKIGEIIDEFSDVRFVQAIERTEMIKNDYAKHQIRQGDFVAYINQVDTYRLNENPHDGRAKEFIESYLELTSKYHNDELCDIIIKYFRKLDFREFSLWQLNFLLNDNKYGLALSNGDKHEIRNDYYKRLLVYIKRRFGSALTEYEKLAYKHFVYNKYNISNYDHTGLSYYRYMSIVRNPDYASLLCARHMYRLVFEEESIGEDLSKVGYILQPINIFLLTCISDKLETRESIITQKTILKRIGQITDECINGTSKYLKIMPALVYIAQRLVTEHIADLTDLYKKIDSLVEKIDKDDEPIVKSALDFIYTSNNDKNRYARELVCNYDKRKHYRHYLQMYYGDFQLNQKEIKNIMLDAKYEYSKGFDYINTFIDLHTSIEYDDGDYPSCRNIIMLCDLLFSRLQNLLSYKYREIHGKPSMFGVIKLEHLKQPVEVLKITRDDVNFYLQKHSGNIDNYTMGYLNSMKCLFSDCIDIYDDECKKEIQNEQDALKEIIERWKKRIHPSYELNRQLTAIHKFRLGWKFKESISHYENIRAEINEYHKAEQEIKFTDDETISDHVYACELIATLFLPESGEGLLDNEIKDYEKSKVIALLQSQEFGQAIIGDYPFECMPQDEASTVRSEINLIRSSTLILGNIYGFNCGHKFFDLAKKQEDIHSKLAQDIIMIQREYKKMMLKEEGVLEFVPAREKHFTLDRANLRTQFGDRLYDTLIKNNPNFTRFE